MKKILGIAVLCLLGFSLKGYTIIIDPGHGGRYIGTCSFTKPQLVEKHVALELSKKLAELLRKKGYTVVLTREGDYALDTDDLIGDLIKRAKMSTDLNADIYLSIHLNGSLNKNTQGYEVYVPYEDKYPMKSYQLASALHYDLSHKIPPQFYGGSLGNLNALDKGIRASRFNVIKRATCPAVLVELAYLTHPGTAKKLRTEEYQDLLVNALYCGIRRYMIHSGH